MVRVSVFRRLSGGEARQEAGRVPSPNKRAGAGRLLLAAGLALTIVSGGRAEPPAGNAGAPAAAGQPVLFQPQIRYPEGLSILFNGSRMSKILPCGCRGRNLGGIDKEATVMEAFRSGTSASLALEAGGFFREFMDENLKLSGWYLLQALKELKYDAVNVGYPDFRHGIDVLLRLQKETGLPFISANIVDAKTKQPYFETHKTFEVTAADGKKIRVGVIGVTAPNATASNPAEQVLPRRAPPLEVPVQPGEGAAPPTAQLQLPLPVSPAPAARAWVLGGSREGSVSADGTQQGGSANPHAAAGGHSPALQFALDTTTPTMTRGMYEVLDEVAAIEALAKRLRPECDVMVLLAYAGPQRSRQIAEKIPAFDIVIGGDAYQLYEPYYFGPTNNILWAAPEHDGRLLGKVEIRFEDDGTISDKAADIIPIDQYIPGVPALTKLIDGYKRDTPHLPPPRSRPLEKTYVGAGKCASCHQEAMAQWKQHPHSHAMKTLIDKEMQFNPDCLRCHTVGYGKPGGFTDLRVTLALGNVQCESCHGPGNDHVAEERRIAAMKEMERAAVGRKAKMNMHFDAKLCMECHDPENDPVFDFALDIMHVDHQTSQSRRTRKTAASTAPGMSAVSASQSH